MSYIYLAHISDDKKREQTIKQHALGTARLAGAFASAFDCYDWGYGCGIMHDLGKYSDSFQRRLRGGPITDHATAGAQELYKRKNFLAAYCTAGHHSGLLDGAIKVGEPGGATLWGRLTKTVEDYSAFKQELEIPPFSKPPLKVLGTGGFSVSFFVKMLFSCLVDADYLDTESFMLDGQAQRGGYDSLDVLYERLYQTIEPWLKNEERDTVNGHRTQILRHCLDAGGWEQGIYQLSVPTGGGKTISSLAFALAHARKHHLERVIYVIPYTSIIEQNAQVFKDILGDKNVLEHHSNATFECEEEYDRWRFAAENWDCPIVVTTNVQFFESLFANRPSKCRKLHNIAKSVIIFDEAQMLPVDYLKPCARAIAELAKNYHCTPVLCTATQPDLKQFFPKELQMKELCPDRDGQYHFFKRTSIEKIGQLTEEELIGRLSRETQVLCILNSRKLVQRVYTELRGEGTYHLSTLMYPADRKRLIQEIRERLQSGKSCRLIATSLVEAGVDFDFETVFREQAGIDSVIQAAGRCNREGKRAPELCKTYVFTMCPVEDVRIPSALELPISVGASVTDKFADISSLEAIHQYFGELYRHRGESLDKKQIVSMFEAGYRSCSFPFKTAADLFRLIEQKTMTILVDLEPEAQDCVRRLRQGECSRQLMRDAGMYCVNIFEKQFTALMGAGKLEQLTEDFYLLRNNREYDREMGLVIESSRGDGIIY